MLSADFLVILSIFCIIFMHVLFPAIRRVGGRAARVLNTTTCGFGLTHWLLFNTDVMYKYAAGLHQYAYTSTPSEFLFYLLLCAMMLGVLFMYGMATVIRFLNKNDVPIPDLIYRLQLCILFSFNLTTSFYIPGAASHSIQSVLIHTMDCVISFSLADYFLSTFFPKKYNFNGRLFGLCGVMLGILAGYSSSHHEQDWYFAFFNAFTMGCEMILIMMIEFARKDTETHYWTFFFSVVLMTVLLGGYYYTKWGRLL